jgi:multisubunit Na+/H+ antiporter MnhG subunit
MIAFLFHLGSALAGGLVSLLLVFKLVMFPDQFNRVERIGMGLVGGTMILRVGPLMSSPETNPFSNWSTFVMTVGLVMMHWGRLARLIRHARRNTLAADAATAHLKARGKL